MNHYERLDVPPAASEAQVRQAFRRAAQDAHPDRHGDASSARMAEINEAWRVLGDPDRRRAYDDLLGLFAAVLTATAAATAAGAAQTGSAQTRADDDSTPSCPLADHVPPARRRFRWRAVLAIEALAVGAVLTVPLLTTSARSTPDPTLRQGDCIVLDAELRPIEVSCSLQHDAVVELLVPFGTSCPEPTLPYRNRTARICVVSAPSGAVTQL